MNELQKRVKVLERIVSTANEQIRISNSLMDEGSKVIDEKRQRIRELERAIKEALEWNGYNGNFMHRNAAIILQNVLQKEPQCLKIKSPIQ